MSVWAKLKNYFFGIPLKKQEEPSPAIVAVENKLPDPPKEIHLQIKDLPPAATITIVEPTFQPPIEIAPAPVAPPPPPEPAKEPEQKPKKKAAAKTGTKKTSTRKKS